MPELPEVETVVRELRQGGPTRGASVVGRTLARVTVRWPRHIATPSARGVQQRLPGQTILGLRRRGKYLIFDLTHDVLLIHLKMSGDLTVVGPDAPPDKHAHTVFHFTDGSALRFSDTRKFGKVFVVGQAEEIVGGLGPEPLEPDFTAKQLGRMLAARHRQLKPLLLDQTFLAGLGNIYTDEALHLAGLHPLRLSDSLSAAEVRTLWQSIRRALRAGLRHNGASIDWVYRGGGYQRHFRVYGRAGRPCLRCGTPIRRMVVGQRGTHYCPTCQPLPGK
ncbi:MAG: DNA-formamidopyrimidine glycosylase [Anaerolineales bacterium]|nr:DNA-formamidopyrimidine glycosylase [Anaerolineales bacterium]